MDRTELKDVLLDDFDMQPAYIEETLNQVEKMDSVLREAFFTFLETKEMPDISEGDYSCKYLVENHGFTVVGAVLFLDWMKKNYDAAEAALIFV